MLTKYTHAAEMMSQILQPAKNMTCAFFQMTAEYIQGFRFPELVRDNRGHQLMPGDWYVIVTCENGHKYHVNVTSDSVTTMCAEVFDFIQYK